jgi:hypothetical protein
MVKAKPASSLPVSIKETTKLKKENISTKDLPRKFQDGFCTIFVPRIRQLMGTLEPWETLQDYHISGVWVTSFLKEILMPNENNRGYEVEEMDDELMAIIMKLVSTHRLC